MLIEFTDIPGFLALFVPFLAFAFGFRKKQDDEDGPDAYESLVTATFEGVAGIDGDGTLLWVDDPFTELTAYPVEELEGRPFTTLSDPADAEKVQQYLQRASEHPQAFEMQLIDGRGELHIVRVTAVPSQDGEQAVSLGLQDITEEEALRRRITFTEKTDLISRLTQAIGGDLARILRGLGEAEEMPDDERADAVRRLASLLHRVERFPSRGIHEGVEVDLSGLVQDVAEEGEMDGRDLSRIELEMAADLPEVFGNPSDIRRAIEQVLLNALEAVNGDGSRVTVRLDRANVQRGEPHRGFILPPGTYARIVVVDEGPGIPPEIIDHVFEPLFSTKTDRPLAGLGLAATYAIVKNHRGYVDLQSAPGSGTTVEIFLPRSRVREQMAAPETVEEKERAPGSREAEALADAAAWPDTEEELDEELEDLAAIQDAADPLPSGEDGSEPGEEPEVPADEGPPTTEGPEAESEPAPGPESTVEPEPEPEPGPEPEPEPVPEPQEILSEDELAALSGHETILVVEEDLDARRMIADSLSQVGYTALPARNWVEGVDLFKRHGRLVNLVIINVQVPEMVWVKTLMDLRKVDSGAKVALMGDEERTPTMERYLDMEGVSYLTKPLTMDTLLRGVRSALDTDGPETDDSGD